MQKIDQKELSISEKKSCMAHGLIFSYGKGSKDGEDEKRRNRNKWGLN